MIGEGRVQVDGQVVRRFGARVDPAKQIIHVDGKRIPTAPDLVYYALNKPIGVVSTMEDPEGRPCLADYVQELAPRAVPRRAARHRDRGSAAAHQRR